MPADIWTDAARIAACYGLVAARAVPVGLIAWGLSRRFPKVGLCPARVPWSGAEIVLVFVLAGAGVPLLLDFVLTSTGLFTPIPGAGGPGGDPTPGRSVVRGLWVGALSAPVQLAVLVAARMVRPPTTRGGMRPDRWPAAVMRAVGWWVVLTPGVLAVHAAVNALVVEAGGRVDEHPLARHAGPGSDLDVIFLVVQAAVAAPLLEELLFRGMLLGWIRGGPGRLWELRVLGTLAAAGGLAVLLGGDRAGVAVAFAGALALGWLVVRRIHKSRAAGGVYASAVLFAAMHSSVWPTPIPLFVLGLGLGWVGVRTNGVLAPFLIHGLFNTVSVVYVLGGGA